jgi:hypothetical protein
MNSKDISKIKTYNSQTKAKNATISVFPTIETFHCFKESGDNKFFQIDLINIFIEFAYNHGLISEKTETAFQEFIIKNKIQSKTKAIDPSINFEFLIHNTLNLKSGRQFIRNINKLLQKELLENKALKISISSLSRLKESPPDTITKRNALRFIAFWIGFEYPDFVSSFNYEILTQLCPRMKKIKSQEGVRILFYLKERGEDISEKDITWFRNELRQIRNDLKINYSNIDNLSKNRTKFLMDLHLIKDDNDVVSNPRSFARCVRDSIAISHQISNRWTLSEFSSNRKSLIIGIATGSYNHLNFYLDEIINKEISENSVIRMTDFTRLCILTNDIKIIICSKPQISELPNGEKINIWWITAFWSTIYWDYIPVLLEEKMLPTTKRSYKEFKNAIYFPDTYRGDLNKALTVFHHFPHDSFLILEIAKVCTFRKMFHEAIIMLSMILASDPYHIVARTFRMNILLNMALNHSKFSVAELYFNRAINEGIYITNHCIIEDEEFWCEFGLVYLGMAIRILSILRSHEDGINNRIVNVHNFNKLLNDAHNCFEQAANISPLNIGNRTAYWFLNICSLKKIFETNNKFIENNIPIIDKNDIYNEVGKDIFEFLGWIDSEDDDFINKKILAAISIYENSLLQRSYIPNIKLSFATLLFDFSPVITVGRVRLVLKRLEEAIIDAEKLKPYKIGAVTRSSYIQSPENFITRIDKTIELLKNKVNNFLSLKDNYIIDRKKLNGFKIFLATIEDTIQHGLLV